MELLHSLGIVAETGLTREGAQDRIREALRERALKDPEAPWRSAPASERQVEWMRKHGFRAREGITKGEVADIMERLKGRRAAR